MQDALPRFTAAGATLAAITPQLPEHSVGMIDENELGFDLLSDEGNAFAAELGLRFTLPDDLAQLYAQFGINLPVHNGEGSWTLPMPARIVVDQAGTVRAVDVDPDYTYRPEPEATLAAVAALSS